MQAPGRPEEDTRDGFRHGGWSVPNVDEVMMQAPGARNGRGQPAAARPTQLRAHARPLEHPGQPVQSRTQQPEKYVASRTCASRCPAQIDEYLLIINPLVLGTGRRLFADGSRSAQLRLIDSTATTTGVFIASYQPAR
jgi:hypothetical protein